VHQARRAEKNCVQIHKKLTFLAKMTHSEFYFAVKTASDGEKVREYQFRMNTALTHLSA